MQQSDDRLTPFQSMQFEAWRRQFTGGNGYDLVAAFLADAAPNEAGHWPERFRIPQPLGDPAPTDSAFGDPCPDDDVQAAAEAAALLARSGGIPPLLRLVRPSFSPRVLSGFFDEPGQEAVRPVWERLRPAMLAHQAVGVEVGYRACLKAGGFLNADGTGAGKTTMLLATAELFRANPAMPKLALVVAPNEVLGKPWLTNKKAPVITGSYANDSARLGVSIRLVSDASEIAPGPGGIYPHVFVTTYDRMMSGDFLSIAGDHMVVFFDEAHYLKNVTGKTRASGSARGDYGVKIASRAFAEYAATATPGDQVHHMAHLYRCGLLEGKTPVEGLKALGIAYSPPRPFQIGYMAIPATVALKGLYKGTGKLVRPYPVFGTPEAAGAALGGGKGHLVEVVVETRPRAPRWRAQGGRLVLQGEQQIPRADLGRAAAWRKGFDPEKDFHERSDEERGRWGDRPMKEAYIKPLAPFGEMRRNLQALFNRVTAAGLMLKREIDMTGLVVDFDFAPRPEELVDEKTWDEVERTILEEFWRDDTGTEPPSIIRITDFSRLKKAMVQGHLRRAIEPYKIPRLLDRIQSSLAKGRSVVVFAERVNESSVGLYEYVDTDDGIKRQRREIHRSEGTLKMIRAELALRGIRYAELHGASEDDSAAEAMRRFQSGEVEVMLATAQSGGPQPYSAKVLTPFGWKQMGTLRLGDEVIAGDGTRTEVVEIHERGTQPVYRLTTASGASTRCTADHLWSTNRRGESRWKVRDLMFLMKHDHRKWKLPVNGPVDFEPRPVPLDPYLLGLMLGNGSFCKTSPTLCSPLESVLSYVNEVADCMGLSFVSSRNGIIWEGYFAAPFAATGTRKITRKGWVIEKQADGSWKHGGRPKDGDIPCGRRNSLTSIARDLGLWGLHGRDKFVPRDYLLNTPDVRLAILRGLMDTDGSVEKNGSSPNFSSMSPQLAEDVAFLTRSLGGVASVRRKRRDGCYHVNVGLSVCPFLAPEKANKWALQPHTNKKNNVVSIEPDGEEQVRCIKVANPLHTYVTDDFIVTHNTGINLDDTIGNRPRDMIVLTAPYGATENVQMIGRIHRLTTKSAATVTYLFFENTEIDQRSAALMVNKLRFLGAVVRGGVADLAMSPAFLRRLGMTEEEIDDALRNESETDIAGVADSIGSTAKLRLEPVDRRAPAGEWKILGDTLAHKEIIKSAARSAGHYASWNKSGRYWEVPGSIVPKLKELLAELLVDGSAEARGMLGARTPASFVNAFATGDIEPCRSPAENQRLQAAISAGQDIDAELREVHAEYVRRAVLAGWPVKPAVLALYPEIVEQAERLREERRKASRLSDLIDSGFGRDEQRVEVRLVQQPRVVEVEPEPVRRTGIEEQLGLW